MNEEAALVAVLVHDLAPLPICGCSVRVMPIGRDFAALLDPEHLLRLMTREQAEAVEDEVLALLSRLGTS